jgi:hypothetical protein
MSSGVKVLSKIGVFVGWNPRANSKVFWPSLNAKRGALIIPDRINHQLIVFQSTPCCAISASTPYRDIPTVGIFYGLETTKPGRNRAKYLIHLGWLMGLEPTTTGITILENKYLSVLMPVGTININQQLTTIELCKNPVKVLI